jgi:hypothetical protein
MADATLTVVDNRAILQPFGSELIAPYVDLTTTQAGIATTQAGIATAAVAAVFQTAEALADNADGIEEGGYYGALGIPVETEYTRFYARVITGTGTASVTVLDDGYPVHGPVTVGTTATDATIAVTMAVGSEVSFFIEGVTGTVTALYAKIEGLPA